MNRTSRKSALFLAALGVSLVVPAAFGQTVNWAGNDSGDWNDANNWSPAGVPGSSSIADFNGGGNGNTNITLDGAGATTGAILFDSGASSYNLGTTAGDSFTINDGSISGTGPVGAIALTSGVSNSQEIDASIAFSNAAPVITSASAAGLTLGASSTMATLSDTAATPTSLTIDFTTASASTITINDAITGNMGGSTTVGVVGAGAAGTATGGLIITGTSAGLANLVLNGQNTYTGITNIFQSSGAANPVTILIGSNSAFGNSTLVYNSNGTQNLLEAYNGDRTISNSFNILAGFTVADAATPHNLTFSGPITYSSISRTLTNDMYGQTLFFGASPNSNTFTFDSTQKTGTAFNVAFNAGNITGSSPATFVLNDIIQDSGSPGIPDTVSFNSNGNNTPMGIVQINGANTYKGNTTINGETSGSVVVPLTLQIGVSSTGSPGAPTSGPFGQGILKPVVSTTFASARPAIIEPFGTDQTIGNAVDLTNGGFWAGEPTAVQDPTVATAPHNLTFSGPITLANPGKVITNTMPAGAALYFGMAGSPSTITMPNVLKLQAQASAGGGNFVINDVIQGAGQFIAQSAAIVQLNNTNTYSGGTSVSSATLTTATNLSNGTLALTSGTVTVLAQATPGAAGGVTTVPALSMDSASKLDLTNNGMIVQSTTPFSTVQTDIANGAAGGFTGNGITSSLAAAVAMDSGNSHKTGIGYASVSELGNPSSFLGVPITDSNSTLVRYTLDGDSNMDGVVNALDFNALASHFGTTSGGDWAQGDYNNDGSIDTNDFDLLAANYNGNIATAATSSLPADSLGAVVPEPTMMGLVGVSLLGLRRRRSK